MAIYFPRSASSLHIGKASKTITRHSIRKMSTFSAPSTLNNAAKTPIPKLVYGTAWKKERSADLVYQAIKAGFRGIDTAAQPRHYQEKLVGDGIRKAIEEGIVKRGDLYIQTKFTSPSGQDPDNMPYSISQSLEDKIHTSIASSFSNLRTSSNDQETYIDCLVLHSPLPTIEETLQAWNVFQTYVPHKIRAIGISNTTFPILQQICSAPGSLLPSVVQNRFYPDTKWEVPLRKYCREHGMVFQTFWTLTGNPGLVKGKTVAETAEELGRLGIAEQERKALALYGLVLGLEGVTILDGTTREERMRGDLEGLQLFGKWADGEGKGRWAELMQDFKKTIGEQ